jgi:hypothetical protein
MGIVPGRSSREVAELDNYVNKLNPRHGGARHSWDARSSPSHRYRTALLRYKHAQACDFLIAGQGRPPGGLTSLSQSRYLPTLRNGPPLNLHRMRNLSCAVLVGVSDSGGSILPIPENVSHGRWGDAPGLFKVAGSGNVVWMVGGSGLVSFSVNQGPLKWSVAGPRVSPIRRAA